MDLGEQLVDSWRINDRLNRYLLEAVGADALETSLTKGKKVGTQFAHIHNVRLIWLKASAPDLMEGLDKLEEPYALDSLSSNLEASGKAMAELIERSIPTGNVKGFKPHVAAFVGYLTAHESNHRTQIELGLRQAGAPLSDKIAYGLWEWGVR